MSKALTRRLCAIRSPLSIFVNSCTSCGKTKLLGEFHLNKSKNDGRESRCISCVSLNMARKYNKKVHMRKVSTLFECSVVGGLDAESIDEFSQSFALCIEEMIDAGKL